MFTALSGQISNGRQIDLIANNLANVNTTGYRAEKPLFEKVLSQEELNSNFDSLRKDITPGNPLQTDAFSRMRGVYSDFTPGPVENTGNKLDCAIVGEGFFAVSTPQGERYTRAGNFRLDTAGRLITQDGNTVLGTSGEINITGKHISIGNDGTISADGNELGKFRIVNLKPDQVKRESGQLFAVVEGGEAAINTTPQVQSGALEGSNVNAVRELSEMIMASRLNETFKTVSDVDSKLASLANQHVGMSQG